MNSIQAGWSDAIMEVLIIDSPSSTDNIVHFYCKNKIRIIKSSQEGRAFQMNHGARIVQGDIFYFVHADAVLPVHFTKDILDDLNKSVLGCFRFKFNTKAWRLQINSFFPRFRFVWCRGGDQTLFVKREVFEELNGFNEN